jgi:hypothetical protein
MNILKEDARTTYTGPTSVGTNVGSSIAVVTLSATVSDISATVDAAGDVDPGDIGNATVQFVNRATSVIVGTANVIPGSDRRIGTATFDWTVDIGASSSQAFSIGMIVGGTYTRNSTTENGSVTVVKR